MRCHEVDYEIIGNSMQLVEVELDPKKRSLLKPEP